MPLTSLQRKLLRIIAHNRTPQSYVAGGSVMNADDGRYSDDIDLFSDRIEALTAAIGSDVKALEAAGITVEWQAQSDAFHRAVVSDGEDSTRLDWQSIATSASIPLRKMIGLAMLFTRSTSRRTSSSPPKDAMRCATRSTS